MNDSEKDALQQHNAEQMAAMSVNAAGMIQSLLLDLGSNDVYIRLSNPASHKVDYAMVEGEQEPVSVIGGELGLTVTDSTIEVPHG